MCTQGIGIRRDLRKMGGILAHNTVISVQKAILLGA